MGLFGGQKSLLGLDVGSSSVKAVELTRSGQGLVISGMGTAPIESPEQIGEAIQRVLRESGIKSKRCVSSVSGRSVIIRQVPMAQVPDGELRQAVEYEADKYIPFDVAEVQLDAQRLDDGTEGKDQSGQMKVLLVAVKKSLIDEHIALLQSVGLSPVIVDVDVFALGNGFELRNLSLGIADAEVRALVDIGATKTNINIMRGNVSCFHREIYVAGNDLTEAVAKRFGEDPKDVERMKKEPGGALESMQDAMLPILEDIGNEIKLSFDYFENQYDQKVKEVFISGGSAYFPGVDTMLTQVFNLPTKVWDPTEGLEITGYNPAGAGGANSDLAVAFGLASRILGTMGWTARSMPSRQRSEESGAAGVAETTVTIGQVGARADAQSRGAWVKGIGLGILASVVVAAGLALGNPYGYQQLWVLAEGLLLGFAAGWGLWQGAQQIRVAPSRFTLLMAAAVTTLICCGGLLGVRYVRKDPIKAPPPAPAVAAAPTQGPEMSQEQKDAIKRWEQEQAKKTKVDLGDITAGIYIFSHWVVACFVASQFVYLNFRKRERAERRSEVT